MTIRISGKVYPASISIPNPFVPPPATFAYVSGAVYAGATSGTIPAHNNGDTVIVYAHRTGSATVPTIPSPWTTIGSQGFAGSNDVAGVVGYQISDGTLTSTGTWTGATNIIVAVFSGVVSIRSFRLNGSTSAGLSIIYPAHTLAVTDGTSRMITFGSNNANYSTNFTPNPPNTTVIAFSGGGTTHSTQCSYSPAGITSWPASTDTVSTVNVAGRYSVAIEVEPLV